MTAKEISTMSRKDSFYRISCFQDIWGKKLPGGVLLTPHLTILRLKLSSCKQQLEFDCSVNDTPVHYILTDLLHGEGRTPKWQCANKHDIPQPPTQRTPSRLTALSVASSRVNTVECVRRRRRWGRRMNGRRTRNGGVSVHHTGPDSFVKTVIN